MLCQKCKKPNATKAKYCYYCMHINNGFCSVQACIKPAIDKWLCEHHEYKFQKPGDHKTHMTNFMKWLGELG